MNVSLGAIDALILRLREEGMTYGEIALRVRQNWDVRLSPETVRLRVKALRPRSSAPTPPVPHDTCGAYQGA